MKQLLIIFTILLTFFNCSVTKKPEFINIKNIHIKESNSKFVTVTANATFLNKNRIGGELQTDGIKVLINNSEIASISTEKFKVPAKQEFAIPLTAHIPTDSLFSNKNLSGLLGSFFAKKLKIQYLGDIKYKIWGVSHTYKVNKTENLKFKL